MLFTNINYRSRGEFHCCTTDGWICFDAVKADVNPEPQFLHGLHSVEWVASAFIDIKLIEHEPDDYKYNEDEKDDGLILGKSVKNELWDVARLKLIQYTLYKMIPIYPDLEPFDIKYRKQYLKESTSDTIKREIGEKISNLKIPKSLYENPIFHQIFQSMIADPERIRNNRICYNVANALSLLNDYHNLWIQHIKETNAKMDAASAIDKDVEDSKIQDDEKEQKSDLEKEGEDKANKPTFNTSYLDWDNWELNTDPNIGNGTEIIEPPIYSKKSLSIPSMQILPKSTTKVESVRINSIWPFDFVGPCFKFKKNNPDWRCMKCNGESSIALQFITSGQHKMDDERIYFYKSRRTDVTVEICIICVQASMGIKAQHDLQRKTRKFSQV